MKENLHKIMILFLSNNTQIAGELIDETGSSYVIQYTDYIAGKPIFKQRRIFKNHIIAEEIE